MDADTDTGIDTQMQLHTKEEISVGKGEEPVNTRYLDFRPIEPFYLSAVFGAYVEENGGYLVLEN